MNRLYIMVLIFSITSCASSTGWIEVRGSIDTKINVQSLENNLWSYIKTESLADFDKRENYTYQYYAKENGMLLINAMCITVSESKLREEIYQVDDGGACFFKAWYNLETHKFEGLLVNFHA